MYTSVIEVIAEQNLTAADEARIAEILRQSFPTDFEGRSFYQQRPHMRLVWREGCVLAHMSLFLRAIRVGENVVDVVGVGDVATSVEARGRGHATALLDRCKSVASSRRASFLILFGDRELYDRAGFLPATNQFRHCQMVGARTGDIVEGSSPFLRVFPLTEALWPEDAQIDFLGHLF
ncbi:GNAT family N-acetyltransferase [Antarctobacter heliothermus]|uniref:Predicted N-acetyltransferase YhbS n=1 Tax=Antarctobacter heliothermus TaxID=74033 RepID=A0A239BU97_9RHOB|nr:GNAT family N-acetyltransferase [Antarctobacter heliothermus]SNS11615.1 Predicted N-acetyltransferase YhbS [Antarctobacter heliothermus]